MSGVLVGKIFYLLFVVVWCIIRYPRLRRAQKTPIASQTGRDREYLLLVIWFLGMVSVPMLFVVVGWPAFSGYAPAPVQIPLGVVVFAGGTWLFFAAHRDLGSNFSPKLDIRQDHSLVTNGIYRRVRHPMYTAFWLWAIGQALLLANWVAGLAGLIAVAIMYFIRVGYEERMMLDRFGDEYRGYMARTNRIIPKIF